MGAYFDMSSKTKATAKSNQTLSRHTVKNSYSKDGEYPIWTFRNIDRDGIFSFDPNREDFDAQDFLLKMLSFSNMTWGEISKQTHDKGKSKHHFLSASSFSKEAEKRILIKGFEKMTDYIFSFALNNLVRVIGIRNPDLLEFEVIWYDTKHQFAPSKLKI